MHDHEKKNNNLVKQKKEIFVTADFKDATYKEKLRGMCDLFTGLTSCIRDHGLSVDISNPSEIRIYKE